MRNRFIASIIFFVLAIAAYFIPKNLISAESQTGSVMTVSVWSFVATVILILISLVFFFLAIFGSKK